MDSTISLSVGIPLYNEAECIDALLERLLPILESIGSSFEVILIDDGSRDETFAKMTAAHERDPRVVAVSLSRNFGQQTAFSVAMELSRGDALVLMDGDLQDEPEIIPRFVEHWKAGYDVVYAIREERIGSPGIRLAYFLYYRIFGYLADTAAPLDTGDFSLISRRVVNAINQMPEQHRYIRGLRAWVGYKQLGISVTRPARAEGESKYTLRKLIHLALDGMFSFSVAPLRAAILLGVTIIIPTAAYAFYTLADYFLHGNPPQGFTSVFNAIFLFAGVQLIFLGVIGEYIGRIYLEVKRRPRYLIDRIIREP